MSKKSVSIRYHFIIIKRKDTETSGQRIKSLFFILYIWKLGHQYVALLCCTNQIVLVAKFFNLIYFTVFLFCFTIKDVSGNREAEIMNEAKLCLQQRSGSELFLVSRPNIRF